MRNRILIALLIVIALVGGGYFGYLALTPEIVSFSPLDAAQDQAVQTEIEIVFSRPMRPESVLENLTITPEVAGEYLWPDEETMRFVPEAEWPRGVEVQVSLGGGAKSKLGVSLDTGQDWSFSIRNTLLAYLWPSEGPAALYALDPFTGEIRQLTQQGNIFDFMVDPGRGQIFFSAANQSGGSDLFVMDFDSGEISQVLDCEKVFCTRPQVSPDGSRLVYERTDLNGQSAVWLLELEHPRPEQVSQAGHQARLPNWSPNGWLSWYDVTDEAYWILDLENDETIIFPNQAGEPGTWSSSGLRFIVQELFPVETEIPRGPTGEASNEEVDESTLDPVVALTGQLLSFNTNTQKVTNLTLIRSVEDTTPVFSPDGRWLAFARKYIDPARWTPGRQLWLMRADGSEKEMLTDDPDYKYSAFAWSPDGSQIAVVRSNTTLLTDPPEIWLVDVNIGVAIQLIIGGFAPQWIP